MVSARSVRIGPKLCVVRWNTPRVESKRYVKPEAGEGSGTLTICPTSAVLNWLKSAWKSLLKCAECGCSPGSVASLSTMRPFGP